MSSSLGSDSQSVWFYPATEAPERANIGIKPYFFFEAAVMHNTKYLMYSHSFNLPYMSILRYTILAYAYNKQTL